jgi:hypothetical protein
VRIHRAYKNKIRPPWSHRAYRGREQDCLEALQERFDELAYSQDIHRLYMEAIASGWPLLDIICAINVLVAGNAGPRRDAYSTARARR